MSRLKYQAILFDLDGTLVDSLRDLAAAVNHVLKSHGHALLDLPTVESYIGDGVKVLLARAFLGWNEPSSSGLKDAVDVAATERERQEAIAQLLERAESLDSPPLCEALDAFRDYYAAHLVDHTRLYPGVEEALAGLRSAGLRLGVVSNKPEEYTASILESLHVRDAFDVVVGGDTVGCTKPDPAPVRHAVEKLGTEPARTLMVGDSTNDILSGQRAGCRTAVVSYGMGDVEALALYDPDHYLGDIRDLLE